MAVQRNSEFIRTRKFLIYHVIYIYRRLKMEMVDKYRQSHERRRDLEDEWSCAAKMKKSRDFDEKLHRSLGGDLVHESCDKYHR